MKTFIYIDNFRGFKSELIPISDVNFLVGENSTGKTSFLRLIEIFSDPAFWFFEPRFGGHGTPQEHFLDLVSASSASKKSFTVGAIEVAEGEEEISFGMLVTYVNADGRAVPNRVSVISGLSVKTVDGQLWKSAKGEKYKARVTACPASNSYALLNSFVAAHCASSSFSNKRVSEERERMPLFMRFEPELFEGKQMPEREPKAPFPFMSNFIELAPIRTKPRRTYDSPQTEFSPEGLHTPYVIKKQLANKNMAEEFKEFLERAGKSSGLFKSISVKSYGQGSQAPFEMKVVLGDTALNLQNVGYGVSQALPVLVEMFVRRSESAFTIQQPEVHLHPRAQATFGDLIAELSRSEEKKFFVETHSDFTIDRFRLNIRQYGHIPSQLLFFERVNEGNKVTSIPILSNGDLGENQPDSYRAFFFNESLALLS